MSLWLKRWYTTPYTHFGFARQENDQWQVIFFAIFNHTIRVLNLKSLNDIGEYGVSNMYYYPCAQTFPIDAILTESPPQSVDQCAELLLGDGYSGQRMAMNYYRGRTLHPGTNLSDVFRDEVRYFAGKTDGCEMTCDYLYEMYLQASSMIEQDRIRPLLLEFLEDLRRNGSADCDQLIERVNHVWGVRIPAIGSVTLTNNIQHPYLSGAKTSEEYQGSLLCLKEN